jgi:hypothetical protein
MAWANGQIPSSALGDVPGQNAGLVKPAALAYKAMHYASVAHTGVSLAVYDGTVGRTYRSYARQVLAKRIYGPNAATPGYSNHGWGLAVDLMSGAQRSAVDRVGEHYGWAKKWSDASWEWWHVKYRSGIWEPRPDPLLVLRGRQRLAAERLLYHRRERKREARSGRGRRWRAHDRWVKYWYGRVDHFWQVAIHPNRKVVLRRVLDDRDGRI